MAEQISEASAAKKPWEPDYGFAPLASPLLPSQPIDRPEGGWVGAIIAGMRQSPVRQAFDFVNETIMPSEPGYSAFDKTKEDLTGYEQYGSWFVGSRSAAQTSAIKARIDRNNADKRIEANEGGFWTGLAAAALDPINFVPLPGVAGSGLVRGALRTAASVTALQVGASGVQLAVDPTADIHEELAKLKYAAVFGALIGGALGRSGMKAAADLGARFTNEVQDVDRALGATPLEHPTPAGGRTMGEGARAAAAADEVVPVPRAGTADNVVQFRPLADAAPHLADAQSGAPVRAAEPEIVPASDKFVVTPTPETGAGLAPAYGFEKVAAVLQPLNRLIQSGVLSLGELAQRLGGDFGVKTVANTSGRAAPQSAYLRSQRWVAMSKGVYARLEDLWQQGLTGGKGLKVGGFNVPAAANRVRQFAEEKLGRAGDELTFEDFNDAVFAAHKADRLEVPDTINGKTIDPQMKAAMQEALPTVRAFFDEAMAEGYRTGWLRSEEFTRRQVNAWRQRVDELQDRLRELGASPATGAGVVERAMVQRRLALLDLKLSDLDLAKIPTDEKLAQLIEGHMERLRQITEEGQAGFDRLDAYLGEQRALREDLVRELEGRLAAGQDLTPEQTKLLDDLTSTELHVPRTTLKGNDLDPALATPLGRNASDSGFDAVFDSTGPRLPSEAPDWHQPGMDYKAAAEHLDVMQELADTLAAHLDMPAPKLWLGENRAGSEGVMGQFTPWGEVPGGEIVLQAIASPADQLVTMLHEFAHAVDFKALRSLPSAEQKAVVDSWKAWLKTKHNKTIRQVENSQVLKGIWHKGNDLSIPELEKLAPDWARYRASWEEWIAEKGVAFLTEHPKATSVVERFFAGVTDRWAEIYRGVTGRDGTPAEVARFYEGRWKTGKAMTLEEFLADPPDALAMLERLKASSEGLSPEHVRLRREIDRKLNSLMGDITGDPVKNEPHYLPREWDIDRVMADTPRLQGILQKWFADNPGELRPGQTPDKAAAAVIDGILAKADDPLAERPLRASAIASSHQRSREVKIPNELVQDFVVTNVAELVDRYARRAGVGIEYSRMFGSPLATDAIEDALIQAAREAEGSAAQIAGRVQGWRNDLSTVRDTAMHRMGAGTPLTADRIAVDTLINVVNTQTMGKVVYSAIVEAARTIIVHGWKDAFEFGLKAFAGQMDGFMASLGDMKKVVNEGWDVAHGMQAAHYMAAGGINGRPGTPLAMKLDRATRGFNNFAQSHYFVMNGLAHLTDALKNYALVMTSHFLIDDVKALAAGTLGKKQAENLLALGIDEARARAIVAQPIQKGTYLNLPNLSAWTDREAAMTFASAVSGEVRRIVVTPGPGDKSAIQQGYLYGRDGQRRSIAIAKLPFQFMSWGLAANNKVVLSALQGRDASALSGMGAMIGMGYLSFLLKTSEGQREHMGWGEQFASAVELSGILGSLTDVNNLIETGTMGTFGARPLLGLPPKFGKTPEERDALTTPFGAVGTKAVDLYDVFTDPYKTRDQKWSIMRRQIPLNNLFYIDQLGKNAQEMLLGGVDRVF